MPGEVRRGRCQAFVEARQIDEASGVFLVKMPRRLRFTPEDHLVEVTSRTIQSRFILLPRPEFEEITTGILGRAQERTGMIIHGYSFQSNHYHLLLKPADSAQLARFMCLLNGNLAREAGRLYGWPGPVFARRYSAIVVDNDEGAQADRLRYTMAQGCKEGLISSPREWPGANCVNALLTGIHAFGIWFDRTREYRARHNGVVFGPRDFTSTHRVVLSPLPCWEHLGSDQYRQRIEEIVIDIESETAAQIRSTGRKPPGAAFVRRMHPHDRPRETKRSPAPAFHAATRAARERLLAAYRLFVDAYRRAAERLARGDLAAVFPAHSFPPSLPYVRGPAACS